MASASTLYGLPDDKKNIIWVLTFVIGDSELHKTGFSVTDRGHIVTTAHLFDQMPVIKARRLDQKNVSIVQVVGIRPNWNLAILKINKKTPYGEFSCNGNLEVEQPLLYIGHPLAYVGSCLFGTVSFPCVDNIPMPDEDVTVCKVYQPRQKTPTYRIMGHVYNKAYFKNNRESFTEFIGDLHPLVPIVQANGFCSDDDDEDEVGSQFGGEGLEGGPMFNTNGQIVGMMFTSERDCQLGIHVSLLKHFMQLCQL